MDRDKRYLLFGYDHYYPSGGLQDLIGSYDSIPEAVEVAKQSKREYRDLYDRIEGVDIDLKLYGVE